MKKNNKGYILENKHYKKWQKIISVCASKKGMDNVANLTLWGRFFPY